MDGFVRRRIRWPPKDNGVGPLRDVCSQVVPEKAGARQQPKNTDSILYDAADDKRMSIKQPA